MRKTTLFFFCLMTLTIIAQTDYSERWEDFFSYNNVNDFVVSNSVVYALTDNAVFTYDMQTNQVDKLSSVNGLSGETTSAIHYNDANNRLVIGYENGLIEVVDDSGVITISADIVGFNQSGLKRINHIHEYQGKLYIATSFAIVVYDIVNLEFGDTYFIGAGSTAVNVTKTTVFNGTIYAATSNGVYAADVNSRNLIDANNWNLLTTGDFQNVFSFDEAIYAVSNENMYRISSTSSIQVLGFTEAILDVKVTADIMIVTLSKTALLYNNVLSQIGRNANSSEFDFNLNTAGFSQNKVLLATQEFGILEASVSSTDYVEIHPSGPLSNTLFSIDAHNNNLWIVYGGYDDTYTPVFKRQGYTYFNGDIWQSTRSDGSNQLIDLSSVTIDKNSNNRVFISSFGDTRNGDTNTSLTGGLLEVEDNTINVFYNHLNSPLEDILPNESNRVTIRIGGTTFDREGNLWVTNIGANNRLKKLTPEGQWFEYNINTLITNTTALGMNEIVMDNSNSLWIGTRRNGVYVYNENGDRKRALTTEETKGSLPNLNVRSVAVDKNNRVWLGTLSGLAVYNNAAGVFDATIYDAQPVIILDDGIPKKLLGDQTINTIKVDGANNKWFGTDNGGVLYTNPNGQVTLANFNKDNSPLPSNKILKIAVDDTTGKVYFATDKGIVAYDSKVSPFGDVLNDVYAYPNPVLKIHNNVTIDGRNGTSLPKGTNVKIVDVSGNLVYETNVVEGEQVQGGKVVWNKRNLAGNKVASGIYIVLLANDEGSETATTKIAIVN